MSHPQPDLFHPEPRTRIPDVPYAHGSATSKEAAERAQSHAWTHEADVYERIVAAGEHGITRKQLAARIAWADNQQNRISGRVFSLMRKEDVHELRQSVSDGKGGWKRVTVRRDGSAVLIATRAGR